MPHIHIRIWRKRLALRVRKLNFWKLLFRAWFYFRQGYNVYLAFLIGFASNIVVLYKLGVLGNRAERLFPPTNDSLKLQRSLNPGEASNSRATYVSRIAGMVSTTCLAGFLERLFNSPPNLCTMSLTPCSRVWLGLNPSFSIFDPSIS